MLVLGKVKGYGGSLSSLIGIWEGFYEINPNQVNSNFVIFTSGGYDGQFFYFLAKDMFAPGDWGLILDSYYFRLHRIGLSFLVGLLSFSTNFDYYPEITLFVLIVTFLASVYCLYLILPDHSKWLSIIYLFSPFSLNSNLLLVADSLFVSFAILGYFFYAWNKNVILSVFFFFCAIFTRELGVLFLVPIVLKKIVLKDYKNALFYALPAFLFLSFLLYGRFHTPNHLGTNPLSFTDMIDFPLFGFFKSFYDNGQFHFSLKEIPKLLFFVSFFLILISIYKFRYQLLNESEIVLPILGSMFVILIAEEGYWRSFDNLSRMFTLILPFSLLLARSTSNKYLSAFWALSIVFTFFITIRVFFISPIKGYYLAI